VDRGIWVTWYDLPDDGRQEHLDWVHKSYIPEMLKGDGYRWAAHYRSIQKSDVRVHTSDASVPAGTQYLLLFGADYADVFGAPVPSKLHASLPAESRKMLAQRVGERMNIMAEAGRMPGPQLEKYKDGAQLAPCIQMGAYNCPWDHEDEMLQWYIDVRMPALGETEGGGIRIRKLASVAGWAKHAILYEFTSVEARHAYFKAHQDRPDMKPWLEWVAQNLTHAPGSSSLGERIWPPIAK
jgi:hypothetical protein